MIHLHLLTFPFPVHMNLPVVPLNSTLGHPADDSQVAPIDPILIWYKGIEVHSYLFEVTDDLVKTHFGYTRPIEEAGFEITVVDFVNEDDTAKDAPIWLLNGYSRGIVAGVNGGAPDPNGHKNVIGVDRGDEGYSPIWRIFWVTKLPVNYSANEISHPTQISDVAPMPMWVNCPNIGLVGGTNPDKKESGFETTIDASKEANWISGSDMMLAMGGVKTLALVSESPDGTKMTVQIETNEMGTYEYELSSCDIAPSATVVDVEYNSMVLHSYEVENRDDVSCGGTALDTEMDADVGADGKDNEMSAASPVWYSDFAVVATIIVGLIM